MAENAYIEALSKIPKGETRTFGDVARIAGRPTGARAAGRIVSSCPSDSRAAWYRAVTAEGGLSIDPERAAMQLAALRKEGARPKEGESVARWAKRVKAAIVGDWRSRRFVGANDERIERFDPRYVERFASPKAASARGFEPWDAGRAGRRREPKAAAAPPVLREAPLPKFQHDVLDVVNERMARRASGFRPGS